jgi:hypothetical protein
VRPRCGAQRWQQPGHSNVQRKQGQGRSGWMDRAGQGRVRSSACGPTHLRDQWALGGVLVKGVTHLKQSRRGGRWEGSTGRPEQVAGTEAAGTVLLHASQHSRPSHSISPQHPTPPTLRALASSRERATNSS